jgi:hypothetical protein
VSARPTPPPPDEPALSSPRERETVLCPARLSRRRLPVNFREEDRPLFAHELERTLPAARLLELRDVWASSDGYLFKGRKILPESFAFPSLQERWKKRSLLKFFANNYLLRKRRRLQRDAAWIVDDWSGGYFHWIADALTRLYVIRERLPELTLLLPHQYQSLDFVLPSLEAFGARDIEFIGADETLICQRLFVPTHTAPSGHYDEEIIGGVRALLLARHGDAGSGGRAGDERIYISRGSAGKRKIANEEVALSVLGEFGFEAVRAEDYSFAEQVRLASRARYLVSNHGAGLTNMLFLRTGGSVLELRHREDRVNNCYFTLANALGLSYYYQTCEARDPRQDPHVADLLVNEATLRKHLCLMLYT